MNDALSQQNVALRRFFRLVVVGLTWAIVSIFPDSANSFYQTALVASIAAMYEYSMLYLDSEGKLKKTVSFMGLSGCIVYGTLSILGFSGLLLLDLDTRMFTFSDRFVLHSITTPWHFMTMVWPMYIFPGLILIEMILGPIFNKKTAEQQGAQTL